MATEDRNLNYTLRRDEYNKKFYERRDDGAVAEKQQYNTAHTKLPPLLILEEMG